MMIPRQLAPTVGPTAAMAVVFFRTGLTIDSGECVASGLVLRFGSLDCVSDNAKCFADRAFPAGGSIIHFGEHRVYLATISPKVYPRKVLSCADPPLDVPAGRSSGPDLCSHAEVMMTAPEAAGDKHPRTRGPAYERTA